MALLPKALITKYFGLDLPDINPTFGPSELERLRKRQETDFKGYVDGKEKREAQLSVQPVRPRANYANVLFIGEAPGIEELKAGKPFAGRSGEELRRWCEYAGIDMKFCYLDNVYRLKPRASDDKEALKRRRNAEIKREIVNMTYGNNHVPVVVPLGNLALETILPDLQGITKHRGSVYTMSFYAAEGGGGGDKRYFYKVIPMLNPTAVLRDTSLRRRCMFDIERVARAINGEPKEGIYWPITHVRAKQQDPKGYEEQILAFFRYVQDPENVISIDIETAAKDDRITCVGFGFGNQSIVFEWPDAENKDLKADTIREAVNSACISPCQKVLHNGLYDAWWLKQYEGIELKNWQWDTLCLAHMAYPADNLGLEYLTSICPSLIGLKYYKDEGKAHFTHAPRTESGWTELMSYCGEDTRATYEIFKWLRPTDDKLFQYLRDYQNRIPHMLKMMVQGVRIDNAYRKDVMIALLNEAREARDALSLYNGYEPLFTLTAQRDQRVYEAIQSGEIEAFKPNGQPYSEEEWNKALDVINEKTVSTKKLQVLLYDKLGLPTQYERRANGETTPTVGNLTLRKLKIEHGDKPGVKQVIDLATNHAKTHKLATFCYDTSVDYDGRLRYSLKFNPESGRFASSKAPNGLGLNSQNIPRDPRLRHMILPEAGHVILKMDLSQVEARFCYMFTRDPELIRLANARPSEYDQHSENAVLLGLAPDIENVPDEARQIAKHIVHGAQRNMQPATLLDTIIKMVNLDDLQFEIPDEVTCERHLNTYHTKRPAVRGVFFKETEDELRQNRCLVNSWGRVWRLEFDDIDDEALRRAYSFKLQSEAADLINNRAFVPMHNWLIEQDMQSRMLLHAHDELVFSCPLHEVYDVAKKFRDCIEEPIEIAGNKLVVPVEYGVGTSWAVKKQHSWKELPLSSEMAAVVSEITGKYVEVS